MADKKKQYTRQNEFNRNNYDRILLAIPKGLKAEWQAKAKAEGLSLTNWIIKKAGA